MEELRLGARFAAVLGGIVALVVDDVPDGEPGAFPRQPEGDVAAEAARAPGDHRDIAWLQAITDDPGALLFDFLVEIGRMNVDQGWLLPRSGYEIRFVLQSSA